MERPRSRTRPRVARNRPKISDQTSIYYGAPVFGRSCNEASAVRCLAGPTDQYVPIRSKPSSHHTKMIGLLTRRHCAARLLSAEFPVNLVICFQEMSLLSISTSMKAAAMRLVISEMKTSAENQSFPEPLSGPIISGPEDLYHEPCGR